MNNKVKSVVFGTESERAALLANCSLHEFVRSSGLRLLDMIEGLNETDEYKANASTQTFTMHYGTWKQVLDYVEGGFCATFVEKRNCTFHLHFFICTFHFILDLHLLRQPEFDSWWENTAIYSYDITIHGNSHFWGTPIPCINPRPVGGGGESPPL